MIEGLKIVMDHTELAQHFNKRAEYHRGKADEAEKELPGLKEISERLRAGLNLNPQDLAHMNKVSFTSNYAGQNVEDLVEQVTAEIRNRRNKAVAFEFMATHLLPEKHVLVKSDLIELEILNRW